MLVFHRWRGANNHVRIEPCELKYVDQSKTSNSESKQSIKQPTCSTTFCFFFLNLSWNVSKSFYFRVNDQSDKDVMLCRIFSFQKKKGTVKEEMNRTSQRWINAGDKK